MLMDYYKFNIICCFYKYITVVSISFGNNVLSVEIEIHYYGWILNDSISHRSLHKELINDNHIRYSIVAISKIND